MGLHTDLDTPQICAPTLASHSAGSLHARSVTGPVGRLYWTGREGRGVPWSTSQAGSDPALNFAAEWSRVLPMDYRHKPLPWSLALGVVNSNRSICPPSGTHSRK